MGLGGKSISFCNACLPNLKMILFSSVLVILNVVLKEWLATDSQNAVLNIFEENYTNYADSCFFSSFYPFFVSFFLFVFSVITFADF